VHKEIGWWIDWRTAARIRITEICKRHPDYTATQVLKALRPPRFVKRTWVSQIMNECWDALGRPGPRYVKGWTPARRKLCAKRMRQWRPREGPRWAARV
jgi:hypothetical protein